MAELAKVNELRDFPCSVRLFDPGIVQFCLLEAMLGGVILVELRQIFDFQFEPQFDDGVICVFHEIENVKVKHPRK
jgi:hypothetical protein